MRGSISTVLVAACAGLLLAACTRTCGDPLAPIEGVEVAGCAALSPPGLCLVESQSELTVWVPTAPADTVRVRGVETSSIVGFEGGRRVAFDPPAAGGQVVVDVDGPRGRRRSTVSVRFVPESAVLSAARAARASGAVAEARSALDRVDESAPAWVRLQVEVERARLAAGAGRGADVIAHRRSAIAIATAEGWLDVVRAQNLAAAHALIFTQGDLPAARDAIDAAAAAAAAGGGLGAVAYLRAVLAQEVQHHRAALDAYGVAERWARRVGRSDITHAVVLARSVTLAELGRFEEAWSPVDALLSSEALAAPSCNRAYALQNRAWVALRALEAGRGLPGASDLDADVVEAIRLFSTACPAPAQVASLRLNRALLSLLEGDHGATRRRLAAVKTSSVTRPLLVGLWHLDLEGRLALAEGRPVEAQALYSRMLRGAERGGVLDAVWRADVGLARVAHSTGRRAQAEAYFVRAEGRLDRMVAATGAFEGRPGLVSARRGAVEAHIGLLLEQRRASDAMQVLLRNRARAVRVLHRDSRIDRLSRAERARYEGHILEYRRARRRLEALQRDAWKVPGGVEAAQVEGLQRSLDGHLAAALDVLGLVDAPSPRLAPAAGEVTLALMRLREGWLGFADEGHRVTWAQGDGDPVPGQVLAAFDAELGRAASVRIVASGALERVDWHAAPWRGAPLSAARSVRFGVDVPASPFSSGDGPWAVVVDPQGDLPGARDEGGLVVKTLSPDVVLEGPAATPDRLRAALSTSAGLHYAGHGRYRGREGWDSALPLAGGALTMGDILALPSVPRSVVLSGCETAKTASGLVATLGIAQAFVLAGAEVVVAASRPVDDQLALALSRALYRARSGDLVADLHRAQAELRRDRPELDWAAFRAITP